MIDLPRFDEAFDYENNFYLSCDGMRMGKVISQYKLFEKTLKIEGDIVECGVFKGTSFSRFGMYRKMNNLENKRMIGFDSFGAFPKSNYSDDQKLREEFIFDAGSQSISEEQLKRVLLNKKCDKNIELIGGDITTTVPKFVSNNPNIKISLLNLDVDIYEPTVTILEYLYPLISSGGIMILDDYGTFPGETNAVNEYFKGKDVEIQKPIFPNTPYFIEKK